mmetsp:Transcript_82401/g.176479  ORF Transcript_82401/g.176479 Transcript_82401/m.176479 type:complete len:302 (-) Transcript_82401:2194-3099(-)
MQNAFRVRRCVQVLRRVLHRQGRQFQETRPADEVVELPVVDAAAGHFGEGGGQGESGADIRQHRIGAIEDHRQEAPLWELPDQPVEFEQWDKTIALLKVPLHGEGGVGRGTLLLPEEVRGQVRREVRRHEIGLLSIGTWALRVLGAVAAEQEDESIAGLGPCYEPLKAAKDVRLRRHALILRRLAVLAVDEEANLVAAELERMPEQGVHVPGVVHTPLQLRVRARVVDADEQSLPAMMVLGQGALRHPHLCSQALVFLLSFPQLRGQGECHDRRLLHPLEVLLNVEEDCLRGCAELADSLV